MGRAILLIVAIAAVVLGLVAIGWVMLGYGLARGERRRARALRLATLRRCLGAIDDALTEYASTGALLPESAFAIRDQLARFYRAGGIDKATSRALRAGEHACSAIRLTLHLGRPLLGLASDPEGARFYDRATDALRHMETKEIAGS